MLDMKIIGAKDSGGEDSKQRTPVEAPDSLHSVAYVRIDDLIGEGPMRGPANGLQSIFFNETPLKNDDGSLNFQNVQIDWRLGAQNQTPIKGFGTIENEISVGVELKASQDWTQSISNVALDGVRIRISALGLQQVDQQTMDINGSTVEYAIDLETDDSGYDTVLTTAITGKTSSKYERSHRIDLPPAESGWSIRVRRLTPDSTSQFITNTTLIESYTELVDAKLRYPNSAHVATTIDASQFSTIPSRAFDWYGFSAVPVPTNYDPLTREYTGIWDGTFKPAWTDNPAWLFRLMATHKRFGLGHIVSGDQINKWELYRIARWCDELVPTGFGGFEPRLTCNLYLQTQEDAYKVLSDLASVFRGVAYWAGGQIWASADQPRDCAMLYTPSNVIDGVFTYSGSSKRARHTVALVSWNDPRDFYRPKVEYVEDRDGIARYGINQTEVIAIGCTSRGQARRMGRAILTTERYETDIVTFGVGLGGVYQGPDNICAPGQVIAIADPLRQDRRQGGRVVSATNRSIVVDKLPTPSPSGFLNVILPDGRFVARAIESVDVDESRINVTQSFGGVPLAQSVWAADTRAVANSWWRVLAVTEDEPFKYTITALYHEPDKYDYIDFLDPIDERVPKPTAPSDKVQSVRLTRFDRKTKYNTESVIVADWAAASEAKQYEIQWRKDAGNWTPAVRQRELRSEYPKAFPGSYIARVSAILANGKASAPTYSNQLVVGDDGPPPDYVGGVDETLEQLQTDMEVLEEIALEEQQKLAQEIIDRQVEDAKLAEEQAKIAAEQAVMRAQLDDLLNAPDWDETIAYDEGSVVKYEGRLYRAKQDVPAGTPVTDTAYWEDLGEYTSLADKVGALALQVEAHDTAIEGIDDDLTAIAQTVAQHAARMPTGEGQLATESQVQEVQMASASEDEALGARITTIEARVPAGTDQFARSSILQATQARVTAAEGKIDANASDISKLETELEGKASTSALNATNARVNTAEGRIDANSNSITDLQAGLRDVSTILNSGFEINKEWSNISEASGYNYQSNETEARSGKRYLRKRAVAGDEAQARESVNTSFTVESGQQIRFGGYVRAFSSVAASTTYGYVIVFYNTSSELLGSEYVSRGGGSAHEWTRLERTITIPASAVTAHIRCRAIAHTNGTIGFDDVFAYPVDPSTTTNASATQALQARVTSIEGVNVAQASDISKLQATTNNNTASITQISQVVSSSSGSTIDLPNPGFELSGDRWGWTVSSNSYGVEHSNARSGRCVLRHFAHEDTKTIQNNGRTAAIQGDRFRVSAWVSSIGSAPDGAVNIAVRAFGEDGSVLPGSAATDSIPGTSLSANWRQIGFVYTVPEDAAAINVYTQATNTVGGIAVDDVQLERITKDVSTLMASWTLVLDVNGYISGVRSTNDGTNSTFSIVADKFRVIAPGGGARMEWANQALRVIDAQGRTRVAIGIDI